MSVFPVTGFGLMLPTTVAAQLNRSLAAKSSPVAAGSPLATNSTAGLTPSPLGALPPTAAPIQRPLAASPTANLSVSESALPIPPSLTANPLGLSGTAAKPAASLATPQADMGSMMASILQLMVQMLCTMLGHNTGTGGTAGTAGTTGNAGTTAQAVPLTSANQLQQTVQQVNAQNPGASPQALAQLLNGRFSNTQFTPQPDGSLLYPLNGQNFKIAANGLTPPSQA